MRFKVSYAVALVTAVILLGITASAPQPVHIAKAAPPAGCWSVVLSPSGEFGGHLNGVAVVSSDEVWAVGDATVEGTRETLTIRWDGTDWNRIPSPNVNYDSLTAVTALSASDIWAVGITSDPNTGQEQTLTMHWNGAGWNVLPSPNVGTSRNGLLGVAALSPTDVWAVGYSSAHAATLVLHWDGLAWSVVPSSSPGSQANELRGVAALSPTDVWAVGVRRSGGASLTLTEHWDGATWSVVPSPNPMSDANSLFGVAAIAPGDVWAVGGGGYPQTLVEHWDGTAWSIVQALDLGLARGISARSANDIWAVGSNDFAGFTTATMHWDGSAWTQAISPSPGSQNRLNSVASVSADEAWAVGYFSTAGVQNTLVERYTDPCSRPTPSVVTTTPSPTGTSSATLPSSDTPTATATSTQVPSVGTLTRTPTPGPTDMATDTPTQVGTPPPPPPPPPPATDVPTATHTDTVTATPTCPAFGFYRVLIVHTGLTPITFRLWLEAFLDVRRADVHNAGVSTPILSQLQQYQMVVIYHEGGFSDPVAMGNVLADYIDSGGVVVAFTYQWGPTNFIQGRYATGGYSPYAIPADYASSGPRSLGTYMAGHPLMQGVTDLSASATNDVMLASGAVQIAAWNTGEPLIAYKTQGGHTSVGVTAYIGDNGIDTYSFDFARVAVNAVNWLAPSPCLTTPTTTAVVPTPTSTTTVTPATTRTSTRTLVVTNTSTPTDTPTSVPACGLAWRVVSSPPGSGVLDNVLNGIDVVSASDIWAVGYLHDWTIYTGGLVFSTLVEHWNGTQWSIVPSPNPGTYLDYPSNRLYAVAAVSANDVWAVGDYDDEIHGRQALVIHWDGTQWSVVSSSAFASRILRGVSAVSANDVWAVGYDNGSTLVMHWNGSIWSTVPSPNPAGASSSDLYGITALSANDVWAVGHFSNNGLIQTLTEHWNGTSWSVVPSPNVTADQNELRAVAAVSANNVWAVGDVSTTNGESEVLVEHWSGTSWSIVSAPDPGPGDEILSGVAAVSANDVWAVGFANGVVESTNPPIILHWNGSNWGLASSASASCNYGVDQLMSIAVVTAHDVWAVGQTTACLGPGPATLVERYNDPCVTPTTTPTNVPTDTATNTITATRTSAPATNSATKTATVPTTTRTNTPAPTSACGLAWRDVFSPNVAGSQQNYLNDLAVVSANDIWAVGYTQFGQLQLSTLTMHWNGTQWSIVPSPNPGSLNTLLGVDAVSSNDAWAVGSYTGSTWQALVEHWDGAHWSVVATPNTGALTLLGVAAISANDVWVGGMDYNGTLLVHWNGSSWSVVPVPAGVALGMLYKIAALSANDVWATGFYCPTQSCSTYEFFAIHWNGTHWSIVPTPDLGGYPLAPPYTGLAVVATNDVWAVGNIAVQGQNGTQMFTLHWDGIQWSRVPIPHIGGDYPRVNGVTGISANDAWAVGFYWPNNAGFEMLALHWDGTQWSQASVPTLGLTYRPVAVSAVSSNDVWAVGIQNHGNGYETLTIHYSDACVTPSPTRTDTPTRTVTRTPTSTRTPTRTVTPTPCSVCNLRVSDVTLACNIDGTVHWTASVSNIGSCAVANATWGAVLRTRIGGGAFTDVRTQSGVTTFPPGNTVVSGDFCYRFLPNTTGIRVTFSIADPNGRCSPSGMSPIRPPCDLTIQCPP